MGNSLEKACYSSQNYINDEDYPTRNTIKSDVLINKELNTRYIMYSKNELYSILMTSLPKYIPKDLCHYLVSYAWIPDLIINKNETVMLKSDIIHEYNNIIIHENGTLTTNGYDIQSNKGGVLLLKISDTLILKNGAKIDLNGLGYPGGNSGENGYGPGKGLYYKYDDCMIYVYTALYCTDIIYVMWNKYIYTYILNRWNQLRRWIRNHW